MMLFTRITFIFIALVLVFGGIFTPVNQANANDEGILPLIRCGGTEEEEKPKCTFQHLLDTINRIIKFVLNVLGPLTVAGLTVYGGVLIFTSAGNTSKVSKGQKAIKYAFIGYAIMLLAYLILGTIFAVIGLADWVGLGRWFEVDVPS